MNWTSGGSTTSTSQPEKPPWRSGEEMVQQRLTNRVFVAEGELEPVDLVLVQRIVIQNLDIHLPFLEVVRCGD